ncbi:MAG: SCO family protein [Geminicoccaceae bacterium]
MKRLLMMVPAVAVTLVTATLWLALPSNASLDQKPAKSVAFRPGDICSVDFDGPPELPKISAKPSAQKDPLPVSVEVTDRFRLIDQDGELYWRGSFAGTLSLVFFGYADCEGVCLMGIPNIADAAHVLDADGIEIRPILITIDPDRDRPEVLKEELRPMHERFVGLTGPEGALEEARTMFNVQKTLLFEDPNGQPVFQHGTFVYLLDEQGELLTLFPPVLPPEQMADIVRGYL